MKNMICVLLMFCATGVFAAEKQSDASPKRVDANDFIIFAWGGMPLHKTESGTWGDFPDANSMMKDLYDCGFNTSGFVQAKYLKDAVANDLKTILESRHIHAYAPDLTVEQADEGVRKALAEVENETLRKSIHSLYIVDEPNSSRFPNLKKWADAVRKHDDHILPYINLFPDYASPEQLGSKDYPAHVDDFVEQIRPQYISYDNYSLFVKEGLDEDRFYGNLETIRKKSIEHGIPFWNVILSNMHFHYAEPSDATLRIQVYSTLAYGGKGIGYFTYYAPLIGNYRFAPIDQYGHHTKTWEYLRNTNLQVHAIAPIYCTLKSVNVFHTGHVPRNAQSIETTQHLESISDGKYLVGEFVDPKGKPYVMVVNKDINASNHLQLKFKKEGRVMLVSPYYLREIPLAGEQHWIAPGAGVLLTVE